MGTWSFTMTGRDGEPEGPRPGHARSSARGINRYVGRAGEYRVAGELLLRGYNACITNVDEGIDVIAVRGAHMAHIQVKTASNRKGRYTYDLARKAYEKNRLENMYYVFVLLDGSQARFVVMPYHELAKQISQGNLRHIPKGAKYRAVITLRDGSVSLGRANNDIVHYLDNWGTLTDANPSSVGHAVGR